MRKRKPRLKFTDDANQDMEYHAHLLSLRRGGATKRMTQIKKEARRILDNPKMYPVEWVHPISLLEFRRKNVDQFAIIYSYFEPTASTPGGLVSVRALRHAAQQNIRWGVEEPGADARSRRAPLMTGDASGLTELPGIAVGRTITSLRQLGHL